MLIAEKRIKDKLAAAARERLVQVSREKQLQMERKRKAALFMASLQRGKEDDAGLIGPKLPTAAELEVLVDKETDLPWITPSPAIVSISSFPLNASTTTVTVLQASTRLDDPHSKDSVVEQRGISSPKNHQPLQKMHQRTRTRSRSGSRSRSEYKKRRRSRSRSRSRINKSRKKKRSSRSPSRERRSHRSSPYSSEKGKSRRERTSSKTPPAAYQHIRK